LMPRPHTESGLDVLYIVGPEFYKTSNGTSPTSKFLLSRRELWKQVDVCCVTIFWAAGPCIVLEPVRVASRGLACP
jgi:hypothetical protein